MKKLNYIFILALLLISCNSFNKSPEKTEEQKGIKRKFVLKAFNYGVEIYLKEDFTFKNFSYTYGCVGGYRIKEVLGKYELKTNKISFLPKKLIWKEDWTENYFNSKKTFDTVAFYNSDTTKIQNHYWYLKKDNIEFLISETAYGEQDEFFIKSSNFIALANLYNVNDKVRINSYVFCNIDTIVNLRNMISKPIIPEKYQKMFFEKPKEFKIKSVKVNKELYPIYEIIKGENTDVFIGMYLYSAKFPEYEITVTEIKDNIVIGLGKNLFYENTKLKIGTILKTESHKDRKLEN